MTTGRRPRFETTTTARRLATAPRRSIRVTARTTRTTRLLRVTPRLGARRRLAVVRRFRLPARLALATLLTRTIPMAPLRFLRAMTVASTRTRRARLPATTGARATTLAAARRTGPSPQPCSVPCLTC